MTVPYFVGYELCLNEMGAPFIAEEVDRRLTDPVKIAKAKAELQDKLVAMPIAGRLLSLCVIEKRGDVVVDCKESSEAGAALLNYIDGSETGSVFFGFNIRDIVRMAYLHTLAHSPLAVEMGGGSLLMPNLPGKLLEDDVMFVDPYHDSLKADVLKQVSLDAFRSYLNVGGSFDHEPRPYVAQALKVRALAGALRLY